MEMVSKNSRAVERSGDSPLPAATDAEQAIIGCCCLDPPLIGDVAKRLTPGDFYDPFHREAARELIRLHRTGSPVDVLVVKRALEANSAFAASGEPIAAYLAECGKAAPTTAHLQYYVGLVREASTKRQLVAIAEAAREHALNGKASSEVLADLWASIDDLRREFTSIDNEVKSLTFRELAADNPHLAEPVVEGLFRAGETVNIIAPPKAGKSWLVYGLALSIINGRDWLDTFPTRRGKVLLVDNELHRATLANRIPAVAEKMGLFSVDYFDDLHLWPLRGNLRSLAELRREFEAIPRGEYQAIVLDAKYRFALEGQSENDNSAETLIYNRLDEYAASTGAAFVLIHHASKGAQGGKSVTDVGAGAGAQSRAADAHLVLREHEEPGVVVLEAAVRSFRPVDPLSLRFEFPLWLPAGGVDPSRVKGRLTRSEERQGEKDREGMAKIAEALRAEPLTARRLRGLTGISRERQERLLDQMESGRQIIAATIEVRGNECKQYRLPRGVGD